MPGRGRYPDEKDKPAAEDNEADLALEGARQTEPASAEGDRAMVERDSQEASAAGEAAAAAETPMMTEPLTGDTMSALASMLPPAIERLTGGAIESSMVSFPTEVAGAEEKLPPAASKHLLAVSAMVDHYAQTIPGLDQYAIDKSELATNEGILQAAMKVDALSKDAKLIKALAKGPAPQKKSEPSTPEPPGSTEV